MRMLFYEAIKSFSLLKSLLEDDWKKLLITAAKDLKSTDSGEGCVDCGFFIIIGF